VDGAIESGVDGRWLARRSDAVRLAEDIGRAGQRQSIARRAARQPAARREILSLLALLGREAPARLLAAAARRQQSPVLDDLDGLARAGLVRLGDAGWATAHDVIGESVADALSREERGRLQQALATALLESEGDPAEVARHLSGAGDREAAAEAFARAASERLERYADEEALVLADSGLALDPDPAVLTSLLETRAEARGRKGDAPGARRDLRQALVHLRAPEQRARVLSKLSILTSSEDASESVALANAALAEAGSDPRSRAEALAAAAFAAGNSDQPSAAEPLVNEARALFETLGDARGLATTVDAQANACFLHGRLEEAATLYNRAARLYRDSGQLTKVGWPLMMVAWCLNLMGRPDEARRGIDYALELERSLGQLEGEAAALLVGAQTAFEAGDTDEARARMPAVLSACNAISSRELLSAALTLSGRLSQAAGEMDEAVVSFKRALEVAGDLAFFFAEAASALAECLLVRGELADAVSYATRATAFEIGPGPIEGHLLLAEIACLRKEPGAEAQAREALRRANANDYRASANRLRLEQLVGSGPGSDPASRQRRTFMFTDIVGSTRLLELMGDEAWGHLLRWHDQVLRDLFAAHGGEEVNRMGDGFFVAFERADAAIACAVAVQRALARHREDHRFAPDVRIGVHWAEATREGADYQGRGVHEAARIGGMAAAGEILVSQVTLGGVALGGVDGIRCSPPRPIRLKGFSDQVDVVSVEWR
jgi:class 3 adenylate cyclase